MMFTLFQVALGGAIGAVARFATQAGLARVLGAGFPWGTFAVNVLGSFVMGALFVVLAERGGGRLSPLLLSGVLGGFTTFSAFSLDALRLFVRAQPGAAALYVLGSVGLSLLAVTAGVMLARMVAA